MVLMVLSGPYINSFNDVGGSTSWGNIGLKLYLTNTFMQQIQVLLSICFDDEFDS